MAARASKKTKSADGPAPATPKRRTRLSIAVEVDDGDWSDMAAFEAMVAEVGAKLTDSLEFPTAKARACIALSSDEGVRILNKQFRSLDKPTNVLSFPALQPPAGAPSDAPRMLGDIAIAYQTTRQEADDEQKPFDHHLSHLAVHGFLHLIGYDHENDGDAEAMEGLETEILAQLGIPDPYADRERVD